MKMAMMLTPKATSFHSVMERVQEITLIQQDAMGSLRVRVPWGMNEIVRPISGIIATVTNVIIPEMLIVKVRQLIEKMIVSELLLSCVSMLKVSVYAPTIWEFV